MEVCMNVTLLLLITPVCSVRKHVERLHAERGDLREGWATVSGCPWCLGELWHVCVGRHCHIIHTSGGDLLPVCHR